MKFEIRSMTSEDLVSVLELRNLEEVRRMSTDDRALTMEEHRAWFYTVEAKRYVLTFNEDLVGVVNVRQVEPNTYEWSFYLDIRRKIPHLGKLLLSSALVRIAMELPGSAILIGKVRAENVKSCKLHLSLGFQILEVTPSQLKYYRILNSHDAFKRIEDRPVLLREGLSPSSSC